MDRFRWDEKGSLLYAGQRPYPAQFHRTSMHDLVPPDDPFWIACPDYRMEERHAWVHFENQWQLSVMWGDAAHASNYHLGLGIRMPFIEEPMAVEVGVLRPNYENEYGGNLWGCPLDYVTVPEFIRLAEVMMCLPLDIDCPEYDGNTVEGFCDHLITAGMMR